MCCYVIKINMYLLSFYIDGIAFLLLLLFFFSFFFSVVILLNIEVCIITLLLEKINKNTLHWLHKDFRMDDVIMFLYFCKYWANYLNKSSCLWTTQVYLEKTLIYICLFSKQAKLDVHGLGWGVFSTLKENLTYHRGLTQPMWIRLDPWIGQFFFN